MTSLVGKAAPFFTGMAFRLENGARKFYKLSLPDYKGKYLLLFFYPLNFTFVCPTEIIDFSKHAAHLRTINTEVLGCSVDSHFSHMEYVEKPRDKGGLGPIDIPLLADVTHQVSKDYGVHHDGIAYRGTFIIDDKQVIRHASVNVPPIGRNTSEFVRLVEAMQDFDKNGEVCPANWKKGDPKIKADVNSKELSDFWANVHAKK